MFSLLGRFDFEVRRKGLSFVLFALVLFAERLREVSLANEEEKNCEQRMGRDLQVAWRKSDLKSPTKPVGQSIVKPQNKRNVQKWSPLSGTTTSGR